MKGLKITRDQLLQSYKNLAERAELDLDFVLLIIASTSICSFGFKMNSPSIIIGAMVISPLLYSIVSVAASSFKNDSKTFILGIKTLLIGVLLIITISLILNLFFTTEHRSEIVDRLSASPIDYFFVAFFSGLAGTFAFFWPHILEAIAGIAIAVALIPPITLIGIGLANFDYQLVTSSGVVVLVNILGIYLGSFLMFAILNFFSKKDSPVL